MRAINHLHLLPSTLLFPLFTTTNLAQSTNGTSDLSKRGLCYISTSHASSDYGIFTSTSSPLTWYYNYSPFPSLPSSSLQYIPMIHSLDNLGSNIATIRSLPNIEYVLVFNEPDGSTGSGGSNISPHDAARAFIQEIMPLRSEGLKVSLPATTGSGRGIEWLQDFNTSCYSLNDDQPCAFDFVATHWYGDFPGLASWLANLHSLYPNQEIWLTEFALPQADEDVTEDMMNASLPYLDGLGYVGRYAWFGAFRTDEANGWTGEGVSLFDGDGGLTGLGSTWLGGEGRGFGVGEMAGGGERTRVVGWEMVLGVFTMAVLWGGM